MYKHNLKPVIILIFLASVLASCSGLKKMQKNASLIQYKVTPEMLETQAGKFDLAIEGRYPAKYFDKKVTLVSTPVLKYTGGETTLSPISVQGEKVQANNKVISNASGGNFSSKQVLVFKKEMAKSELFMNVVASKGSKSVSFGSVKIGAGVLATSEMVAIIPKAVLGVRRDVNTSGKYDPSIDPFQRNVADEMEADIHFQINKSKIEKEEMEASDVVGLQNYTKNANKDSKIDLKGVEVSAYASPDGTIDINTELAAERKSSSAEFLANKLKEAGVNVELKTKYTPEDWDGFRRLMEKSKIQDKDLILRVLSMYNDPEVREREIKNLSASFTEVANEILPQLRRAKMVTSVELLGKTDEELKAIAKSNPSSLNPAELLYAAGLFEDLNDQFAVYNSFSKAYPTDWRGPNNAGYILVKQLKYAEAKPLFEKAEKLKNNEPIVKNNLGASILAEGNVAQAEILFGAAAGIGNEVNYNQGIISLKKADYDQAIRYFGKEADPNTALAKILTGDYNGALKDLESFQRPKCFMKEYLKAIVGARTGKDNLLFDSLKTACDYNADMKSKAKNDMEFVKYFENPKFKAIVD